MQRSKSLVDSGSELLNNRPTCPNDFLTNTRAKYAVSRLHVSVYLLEKSVSNHMVEAAANASPLWKLYAAFYTRTNAHTQPNTASKQQIWLQKE